MSQRLDNDVEGTGAPGGWEDAPAGDFAAARGRKRELLDELRGGPGAAPPTPEELLPRWPIDPAGDPDVASLLFEDFLQRRRRGDEPSIRDYEERFSEHADSLAGLFEQQALLRSVGMTSCPSSLTLALPGVGDELFHFRLVHELGRGAFARVFLAEQADLAGRPVVLKVSGISGDEPQTLAQLQHTHIVPIYSVHEDARAGLRAVCMPYFGGASLSRVLQVLWASKEPPTQGAQLTEALAGVRSDASAAGLDIRETPSHQLLRTSSYVRATAWIVARLAEGLQHAHQRGVLHRDIKPSNVLLTTDGQPMLLDFNLAQSVSTDEAQAAAALGGTVAYMAPEHLRALALRDAALVRLVDHRADIYSLGMVLYEMLAGHGPFQQSASYSLLPVVIEAMALERSRNVPSVRQRRSDVPWGLESIARKCLAPDPAQRYQQAQHLAEDLDAFLADLPLRYAPELSKAERLRKWLRRHPRLTSSGSVATAAAVLLLGAGAALVGVRQHLRSTQAELAAVDAQQRKEAFEKGAVRTFFLLYTNSDLPDQDTRALPGMDHLRKGLEECEATLRLYNVLDNHDWQNDPAWQRLEPEERERMAEDVRELLLLWAWAQAQLWQRDHGPAGTAVYHQALALVERAEAIPGLPESPAVWMDRASYLRKLGDVAGAEAADHKARTTQPATFRDHYLLALALINSRRADDPADYRRATRAALAALDRAVQINGQHYWSLMQRGICQLDLGEPKSAACDFSVCIGLWPKHPWGYFNRGVALDRMGLKARAIADYTVALDRDAGLAVAYQNRGIARLELLQNKDALDDLDRAARLGLDTAALHSGRGVALERLAQSQQADARDADAAFARARELAPSVPADLRLRMRCEYGFAVSARLPDEARKAFEEVLEQQHQDPHALYGLAMLAEMQGRNAKTQAERQRCEDEAIVFFSQALAVSPGFVEARRFRAVLLARRGDVPVAEQEIDLCLGPDAPGITYYAAACIASQAIRHTERAGAKAAAAQQALLFLEKAFEAGYGLTQAAKDKDLDPLRQHPEFKEQLQKLLQRASAGRPER